MGLSLNYFAIFVAVLFNQVFGFLWFSKFFSKAWAKHFYGLKEECSQKPSKEVFIRSMTIFVASSFLTSFVLALALAFFWQYRASIGVETTLLHSYEFSFLIFIGFFLHFHLGRVAWEFKNWWTVVIGASYDFIRLIVLTSLFYYWR